MTPEELQQRNKQNAQHSSGPRTPEGKRRSSLNATRHSLTGQIVCMTPEEKAAFKAHCDAIVAELAPEGPTETFYASSVAESMWRMQRARAIENGIFANGHHEFADAVDSGIPEVDASLAQAKTFVQRAMSLDTLTRYETRILRIFSHHSTALERRQVARKALYEKSEKEAMALTEEAANSESNTAKYLPFDDFLPASKYGGFVYAEKDVLRKMSRDRRVKRALDFSFKRSQQPWPHDLAA